jgi:hypothetical protein
MAGFSVGKPIFALALKRQKLLFVTPTFGPPPFLSDGFFVTIGRLAASE